MAIQTAVVTKPVEAAPEPLPSVFCPETVTIGNQVWMAENLAVDDGGEGISYNEESGEHYYTWDAAMRIAKSIPGWRLPTAQEWNEAALACGAKETIVDGNSDHNDYADALALKDKLRVKLVGYRYAGTFHYLGCGACFWTATEDSSAIAYSRYFNTGASMNSDYNNKAHNYYSVRLVKDSIATTPEDTMNIEESPDKKEEQTIEEMQNILSAIAQGQAIEWFDPHTSTWRDLVGGRPNFNYSHRIKPQKTVTNQELSQWCAEGKGQVHCVGAANAHTFYSYQFGEDDFPVTADYEVRRWASDDWHKPTREYLGLEEA